jgi:hypothetical protein
VRDSLVALGVAQRGSAASNPSFVRYSQTNVFATCRSPATGSAASAAAAILLGLHEPDTRARDRHGPHARHGDGRRSRTAPGRPARTGRDDRDASVPWYRNTIEIDRTLIARFNALIEGRSEPQPADSRARVAKALSVAMMHDADLFRAAIEIRSLLALPQEVLARPGMVDRIMAVAGAQEAGTLTGHLARTCSKCWHREKGRVEMLANA